MKVGRKNRSLQPLMKEGRNKPYTTVGSEEVVKRLTEKGYEGVVIQLPPQETNNIFIFRYPMWLDSDYLLDDSRTTDMGQEVQSSRGGQKPTDCSAEFEITDAFFITGICRRPVEKYTEGELICLRCSRWGHQAWSCMKDDRCRFCGKITFLHAVARR